MCVRYNLIVMFPFHQQEHIIKGSGIVFEYSPLKDLRSGKGFLSKSFNFFNPFFFFPHFGIYNVCSM